MVCRLNHLFAMDYVDLNVVKCVKWCREYTFIVTIFLYLSSSGDSEAVRSEQLY